MLIAGPAYAIVRPGNYSWFCSASEVTHLPLEFVVQVTLPIDATPAPHLEGAPTMDPNTAARKAHDIDIDALQAVPAEPFLHNKLFVIALPGTGSNGCVIPAAADAPFPFGIDAAYGDGGHFTLEYDPIVGFVDNPKRSLQFGDTYTELLSLIHISEPTRPY